MSDFFDPRVTSGPSELVIDAYVNGEADPEEVAAVEAWMQADPSNAAVVEARRTGFDAFPEANPRAMLARIRQGLEAEAAAARPAEVARPAERPRLSSSRFSLSRWLFGGLALAGAAAAIAVFALRPAGIEQPDDVVLTKGNLALQVYRARGDDVTALVSGDPATAGDRLRFVVDNVPSGPGHLLVVGLEAGGGLFPYFPATGRSVAAHGTIREGGALPGSAVLDASTGRERIWLVWCPRAFEMSDLKASNAGLQTRDTCRIAGFALDKR